MQPNDTGVVLETAACEVLETMFFTAPVEPQPDESDTSGRICASVEFRGGSEGRFTACVAEPAARELAEVFLGSENEPGPDAVMEVAGELANMLCGSALARLEPHVLFELAHPRSGPCRGHARGASASVALSGGTLRMYLDRGPGPGGRGPGE